MYKLSLVFISILLGFGFFPDVSAQNVVSGKVQGLAPNQPVSGAHIYIVNLKVGTSTDGNGEFSIPNIPDGDHVLSVSHIRFMDKSLMIQCPGSENLEIQMEPDSVTLASYVVTATRTERLVEEIPQRVDKIDQQDIESIPASNTDNLLKMVPGVIVNRSWGIFSRNASVTMRGMPGSSRSLILLDGVPINKTAGGTVNWHMVTPDEIERIEVVKGPGSSLYGMNAMAGTINIITKKPNKPLEGMINLGYGSYNTIKAQANISGNKIIDSKGLYWKLGAFGRKGDGYILQPEEERDETSVDAFLLESNINALMGYQFNHDSKMELDYRFYQDQRGNGEKVYEEDGSYESFTDHNLRLGYNNRFGKYAFNLKAFYFLELYDRQTEKINNSGEYRLTDTETDKQDVGIWMTFSRAAGKKQHLTFGLDIKNGMLDNQEIYRTSTDRIYTDGNLLFTGLFVQDELSLINEKLKIIAGLRLDFANFYNGRIKVNEPTSQTGFPGPVEETFENSQWTQLSPKLAAKYFFGRNFDVFGSVSYGFMPPKLDDLVGSRKIRRGFKKTNPELTPEKLLSFEIGADYVLKEKLIIKPSVYYSLGDDFQYLVATGEYIDNEGDDPVAVYQRQNISEVEVQGIELGVEYKLNRNIKLLGSYAYNHSKITDYNGIGELDLTGKYLNEVPENVAFLGFQWRNKIINVFVDYSFTDDQWYDEENTEIIEGYSLINFRLSKNIGRNIQVIFDVQDLLDEQFIDRKGYLSPGRFVMWEMKYLIYRE